MKILTTLALTLCLAMPALSEEITVWIGTGGSGAEGIYRTTLNTENGKIATPTLAAEIGSPGFVALSSDGSRLYSLCNLEKGSVAAFEVSDDEKSLKLINHLATGDGGAAHLSLDKTGTILFSAQYGGGSTTSYSIRKDGGIGERTASIEHTGSGPNESRQKGPHPHWTGVDPDGQFLFVPDLGTDKIVIYQIDQEKKSISPHGFGTAVPGGGPRHMKFSSDSRYAYVLNELLLSITVFSYDKKAGSMESIQTIETLPESDKEIPNKASEIRIHPSGKFVYAANRGHDSIAAFSRDSDSGKLSFVEREAIRGSWPRNFNIDPSGKWLIAAGRMSNTLSIFAIDQETGGLSFTGNVANCPAPICVEFQP